MKILAVIGLIVGVISLILVLFFKLPIYELFPPLKRERSQIDSKVAPQKRTVIRQPQKRTVSRQPQIPPQRIQPRKTNDQVTLLRTALENMDFDPEKLGVVNQGNLLPDKLSLRDLTSILKHFDFDDAKVKTTSVLGPRVTQDFSEHDLKAFQNIFDYDSGKRAALRWIPKK